MIDFGQVFVVDTNALSEIGRRRRESAFFRDRVKIPGEVLHEASGFPDVDALRSRLYPASPSMFEWLQRVMEVVPVDDTTLVDLYADRGGADPILVACALDGRAHDSQFIDAPEWVVVTGDDAVRRLAAAFELRVVSNLEFAELIDASQDS